MLDVFLPETVVCSTPSVMLAGGNEVNQVHAEVFNLRVWLVASMLGLVFGGGAVSRLLPSMAMAGFVVLIGVASGTAGPVLAGPLFGP